MKYSDHQIRSYDSHQTFFSGVFFYQVIVEACPTRSEFTPLETTTVTCAGSAVFSPSHCCRDTAQSCIRATAHTQPKEAVSVKTDKRIENRNHHLEPRARKARASKKRVDARWHGTRKLGWPLSHLTQPPKERTPEPVSMSEWPNTALDAARGSMARGALPWATCPRSADEPRIKKNRPVDRLTSKQASSSLGYWVPRPQARSYPLVVASCLVVSDAPEPHLHRIMSKQIVEPYLSSMEW